MSDDLPITWHCHPAVFLFPCVSLGAAAFIFWLRTLDPTRQDVFLWMSAGLAALAVLQLANALLTSITLTATHLEFRRGFLLRKSRRIPLKKIESLEV